MFVRIISEKAFFKIKKTILLTGSLKKMIKSFPTFANSK
jgi:hypothetical protein